MIKIISALSMVLVFSTQAFGGIMFEPSLHYQSANFSSKSVSGSTFAPTDYAAPGLGLKLGYVGGNFWTVLDAAYVTGKGSAGSSKYDVTDTNLGFSVGYDWPKVRVYAGYLLVSDYTEKESAGTVKYKGNAIKIGLGGPLGKSNFMLSVELLFKTMTKIDTGTSEIEASSFFGSYNHRPASLVLSYKF